MKLELLKNDRLEGFIQYCKKHRSDIDESFLHDQDLDEFQLNEENPTYIVTNQKGDIVAACSLYISEYYRNGRGARFRIFYSELENINCYNMLMQAIMKHTDGLDKVFIFVPMHNKKLMSYIEQLNFKLDRYSFHFVRTDLALPDFSLPEGYEIRNFKLGHDEGIWRDIRNASFAKLKGSETPMTSENVAKMMCGEDQIEGGSMILYHKDKPVGIVRGARDEDEGIPEMWIGPLAIIPEYQGKGLGRSLLRALLHFAKENSYTRAGLCVNAENERAKTLYLQEGFKSIEDIACYAYYKN